jgi:sec-independent protein translocase protein TatB
VLNLDPAKLLVIGLLALIVLGPERLPKVARQLGGAWRELVRLRDHAADEVKAAFPIEDLPRIPNVSGSISSAVSSFVRPVTPPSSVEGLAGRGDEVDHDSRAKKESTTRRAPDVVVHGGLGDFVFLPDDPSMN